VLSYTTSHSFLYHDHLFVVQTGMVEHDHTPMFYIMVVPLWWTVQIFTKTSPVSSVRGVGGKICLSSVILWTRSWATPLYSVQVDAGVHTVVFRKIAFRHFFRELCIGFPSFLQIYRLVRWIKLFITGSISLHVLEILFYIMNTIITGRLAHLYPSCPVDFLFLGTYWNPFIGGVHPRLI